MKEKVKLITILMLIHIIFSGCENSDVNYPDVQTKDVTIGVLVSLSGNWSALGQTSKAALEAAVNDINQKLNEDESSLKFNLKVIDTKLDPDAAYAGAEELIADGVEIIIGPQSSAELSAMKPLLDENDVIAISMSSTAGSLALQGDHVLRFCPDDKPEGLAAAKLMWERGIRKVVAVYRDDDGNIGLKKSMTSAFIALGGEVLDSIKYSNDDNITTDLIEQIRGAVNRSSAVETGIYIAGFDELSDIFTLAASDETLSSIIWTGSNGSAMSAAIASNNQAAEFANNVEFCSPLFAMSKENENDWSSISESISQSTGLIPDAYTFAAYDAIHVAAEAYKSVDIEYEFDALYSAYIQSASGYQGLTGLTELNEAGDRKYGNFTMMGICGSHPDYEWSPVGSYDAAAGVLLYEGCNP